MPDIIDLMAYAIKGDLVSQYSVNGLEWLIQQDVFTSIRWTSLPFRTRTTYTSAVTTYSTNDNVPLYQWMLLAMKDDDLVHHFHHYVQWPNLTKQTRTSIQLAIIVFCATVIPHWKVSTIVDDDCENKRITPSVANDAARSETELQNASETKTSKLP